jgi:hypothetical protein
VELFYEFLMKCVDEEKADKSRLLQQHSREVAARMLAMFDSNQWNSSLSFESSGQLLCLSSALCHIVIDLVVKMNRGKRSIRARCIISMVN